MCEYIDFTKQCHRKLEELSAAAMDDRTRITIAPIGIDSRRQRSPG